MSDDTKVVSLRGGPMFGDADPDIVRALETLMDRAKSGQLSGLGYVAFTHDDLMSTHYIGDSVPTTRMIGGLRVLEAELLRDYLIANPPR